MKNKLLYLALSVLWVSQLFSLCAFSQDTVVRVEPASPTSPRVGDHVLVDIVIENGRNVAGYQVMLHFEFPAIEYVGIRHGDYLPADAFFGEENFIGSHGTVLFAATASPHESNGNGTLATLTFKINEVKASTFRLSAGVPSKPRHGTILSDKDINLSFPSLENAEMFRGRGASDLVVESPSVSDDTLTPGEEFILSVTVRNKGGGITPLISLAYYRSGDRRISASTDTQVGPIEFLSSLGANKSDTQSRTITVPTTPGTYYYGACVRTYAGEADRDNNCSTAVKITVAQETTGPVVPLPPGIIDIIPPGILPEGVTVTIGWSGPEENKPDLVIESMRAEPSTVAPGAKFKLYSTLKNRGAGRSSATTLRYYSSTNSIISITDTEIGKGSKGPLSENETILRYLEVTAPTEPGIYYYGACVDEIDNESNTGNNCHIDGVPVTVTFDTVGLELPPDLISEVAYGPNSTYFVLNAQYPILTAALDDFSYGRCTVTLDLPDVPDNTLLQTAWLTILERVIQEIDEIDRTIPIFQFLEEFGVPTPFDILADALGRRFLPNARKYFMFPLETMQDIRDEIQEEAIRSQEIAKITALIGVVPLIGDGTGTVISLTVIEWQRLSALVELVQSTMDPKIHLVPRANNDKLRYLVYIPKRVEKIGIKVEQTYRLNGEIGKWTYEEDTWDLSDGTLAAPSAQLMTLADYPPFQQLSPEVQEYLLRHFGGIENAEAWQIPEETTLLPNYPNPFNPETWIPYQLAQPAAVTLTIYDINGRVVRTLDLGHQRAGLYHGRSRAAYWDGRNAQGEPVASGVYFYTLRAGDFTATRKLLIRK